MPYIVPAITGRMGSTEYFQANMTASSLAGMAMLASELPAWSEWSIFERFQRELADSRVSKQIVPYLARTKDRFFGALIVLVYEPETYEFEPLDQMGLKLGKAYRSVANQMGFLSIDGGELVVLDGQHRLAALRAVVTAGGEIDGEYKDDVAEDQLCVIFIRHESFEKTRRIFNKVNRYAKPTSLSDNIITSEDDGYAIVSRWLVESEPPLGLSEPTPPLSFFGKDGEPIVEWRSAQLGLLSLKLSTLTTVYQTVQLILTAEGIKKFGEKDTVNRPSDQELKDAYIRAARWWSIVLDNFRPFDLVRNNPGRLPDVRQPYEAASLAFRPVAHVAMFLGYAASVRRGLDLADAVRRSNDIDWSSTSKLWIGTLVLPTGRISTRHEGVLLAGRLIAYQIAPTLHSDQDRKMLEFDLRKAKGDEAFTLPN